MPAHPDNGPYPFERRCAGRMPVTGSVMAVFTDHHGPSLLTRVELVDSSTGGLGLRCPVAVQPGDRFTLYCGKVPIAHGTGTVARCIADGDGFRLGARCEQRRAA